MYKYDYLLLKLANELKFYTICKIKSQINTDYFLICVLNTNNIIVI